MSDHQPPYRLSVPDHGDCVVHVDGVNSVYINDISLAKGVEHMLSRVYELGQKRAFYELRRLIGSAS